jgi:rhodanese-related sulfurtransferase
MGPGSEPVVAETETIEPKEAREPVAAGDLYVVDVRSTEQWVDDSERLPGAVHIPAEELDSRLDELPEDKKILIVTPDGEGCEEAAERIGGEDREVVILAGGVEAWRSDRLLTQPSPDADPPKGEGEEPVETPEDEEDEDSDTSGDSDSPDDPADPDRNTEGTRP